MIIAQRNIIFHLQVLVGNRKWMVDNGLAVLPEMEGEAQALEEQGKTVIFVAVDGTCVRVFLLNGTCYDEAESCAILLILKCAYNYKSSPKAKPKTLPHALHVKDCIHMYLTHVPPPTPCRAASGSVGNLRHYQARGQGSRECADPARAACGPPDGGQPEDGAGHRRGGGDPSLRGPRRSAALSQEEQGHGAAE